MDVMSKLIEIVGGKENATELYKKAFNASIDFIETDKAEVSFYNS